jgi:phospholipid/cholesterol/gamma-HCH transport system substrate-binding protein
VPKGSKATVKPIGIFGDVAVALTPPTPVPAASYAAGDTVAPGTPSADVDQIMSRVDSIGQSVSLLMKSLQQEVIAAGTFKELHKTVASTAALSAQLQAVVAEQNKNVTQTLASFRETATKMGTLVDSAQVAATVANLRQTSENAARLSASIDSTNGQIQRLLAQAERGNGTIGKLLSDSLLYTDARRLMGTLDSLVADFKANPKKYINLRIF